MVSGPAGSRRARTAQATGLATVFRSLQSASPARYLSMASTGTRRAVPISTLAGAPEPLLPLGSLGVQRQVCESHALLLPVRRRPVRIRWLP